MKKKLFVFVSLLLVVSSVDISAAMVGTQTVNAAAGTNHYSPNPSSNPSNCYAGGGNTGGSGDNLYISLWWPEGNWGTPRQIVSTSEDTIYLTEEATIDCGYTDKGHVRVDNNNYATEILQTQYVYNV